MATETNPLPNFIDWPEAVRLLQERSRQQETQITAQWQTIEELRSALVVLGEETSEASGERARTLTKLLSEVTELRTKTERVIRERDTVVIALQQLYQCGLAVVAFDGPGDLFGRFGLAMARTGELLKLIEQLKKK